MTASLVDRLSRMMAAPASRRGFLAAATTLATTAATPALASAGKGADHGHADAARRRGNGGNGGNGGNAGACRASGTCSRASDCCSGRCAGRNGRKRCRCLGAGAACSNQKGCCAGLACTSGACQPDTVPTPPPAPAPSCDVCASGCRFASVEAAWAGTPDGETISIAPGRWPAAIAIDRSMTLEACEGRDGVVLEPRRGTAPVLHAPASAPAGLHLALDGLTFRHAAPTGEPLVRLEAAAVTAAISGCRFDLAEFGVAIHGDGCDVTVSRSVFTGAGALTEFGAGVTMITNRGSLAIGGSTFAACATGVAAEFGDAGTVTVDTTQITGCGTGLDVSGSDGANLTAAISGCQFTGNANRGITLQGGSATVTDCTIGDNGGPEAFTGGVTAHDTDLSIVGSLITGNTGRHGGIRVSTDGRPASLTLAQDVLISANTATDFGGGLALVAGDHPVQLRVPGGNVAITGNSAPRASGVAVVWSDRAGVSVSGISTRNVTGNTPGMQCMSSRNEGRAFSEVATCVFGF
ncbi:MAG: right-handed parallel beta-helix repeat-containing protein [Chloroflexota bacterium]